MPTFPLKSFLRLLAAGAIATALLPAQAQEQEAPPQLQPLEEVEVPEVTIRSTPKEEDRIVERRQQGQVTSVTVKSGQSTYQVRPNKPAGSAQPGDIQSDVTRPPQWRVREFDWENERQKQEAAARAATAAPLPPPPLPDNADAPGSGVR